MHIVNRPADTTQLRKNVNRTYVIYSYIAAGGEHFSQLCERGDRFPLFYPAAYCSRSLRQRYTHSTQKEHLFAIKKLYEWTQAKNIDLHMRLEARTFFSASEFDSLANWISIKKKSKNGDTLVGNKINAYLAAISNYLTWYANEIITEINQPEVYKAIDKIAIAIKARHVKQSSCARQVQNIIEKKLSNEMQTALDRIFSEPLSKVNKTANQGPAFRNALALRILYDTGMRVGELLSLTLEDFHLATGGEPAILEIRRNHDDPYDDRIRQPVAKTLGRYIPISSALADMLMIYLKKWRSSVPYVGFENHDFILVTHRKGSRQGKGLEYSALVSAITNLQRKYPGLRGLHPHLLRHDWNYRFSIQASNLNLQPAKEQAVREFLMGWVPGSTSAARYNRRHIQESAFELGLKVSSHVESRKHSHE